MKRNKAHNCLVTFLLSAILFCVGSGFLIKTDFAHKMNKEISASKTHIKTDSFYLELEEDDECDFEIINSLFISSNFNKCKIESSRFSDFTCIGNKASIFEKYGRPIYLVHNVFRI